MSAWIASPLGLFIGLTLGTLGGGGSVLAVPALVYVVGQTPQAATSTSLVIVAMTALGGAVGHLREGRVRLGAGLLFGLAGLGGSVAGSMLNETVPADVLLVAFSALMIVAAIAMLRRGTADPVPSALVRAAAVTPGADHGNAPSQAGEGSARARCRGVATATERSDGRFPVGTVVRVLLAGTAVGFLTGLFGVGGGFVVVPALVLALRFPMPVAIGTSLVVIAVNAITALGVRIIGGGAIDWGVALPFTVAGLVGVVVGTALSSRLSPQRLTRAFAVLLIAVAVLMVVDAGMG